MAKPSLYTPEIVEEICELLSQGIPLEEICRRDGMPSAGTIHAWKAGTVESVPSSVSDDIARAREIGYDVIAANLRNTARGMGDSTNDVQRDKLIIDTDFKLLSKWTKKYNDKIDHTSSDGSMTPMALDVSKISTEALVELMGAKNATNE